MTGPCGRVLECIKSKVLQLLGVRWRTEYEQKIRRACSLPVFLSLSCYRKGGSCEMDLSHNFLPEKLKIKTQFFSSLRYFLLGFCFFLEKKEAEIRSLDFVSNFEINRTQ